MRRQMVLKVAELHAARIAAGLGIAQVADLAGIGRSTTYLAFRTGQCGLRTARLICQAYNSSSSRAGKFP